MKYLLALSFLIQITLISFSQMPSDSDYSEWDWEDISKENWKKSEYGNWIHINSPFDPLSQKLDYMSDVFASGDYKKNEGWHLFWAQFGPIDIESPYFILYNQYRGILRVFFYLDQPSFEDVVVTLNYRNEDNNPAILNLGSGGIKNTIQDYYNETDNLTVSSTVLIRNLATKSWGCADFIMGFDSNIESQKYDASKIEIKIFGADSENLILKSLNGSTVNVFEDGLNYQSITNLKTTPSGDKLISDGNNLSKSGKSVKSLSKHLDELSKSADDIDLDEDSPEYLKTYKSSLEGTSSLATGAGTLGDVLNAMGGFFKLAGGLLNIYDNYYGNYPDQNGATNQAINGYYYTEGEISINKILGGTTLIIPGVENTNGDNTPYPYYNCPLGVLNVFEPPLIRTTKDYDIIDYQNLLSNPATSYKIANQPNWANNETFPRISGYQGLFRKYVLANNLTIHTNKSSGTDIKEILFALKFEPKHESILSSNGNSYSDVSKYDPNSTYINKQKISWIDGKETVSSIPNPVRARLESGEYVIHDYDKITNTYSYRTPFMEPDHLEKIIFEIPDETTISLILAARLTNNLGQEQLFMESYNVNVVNYETTPIDYLDGGHFRDYRAEYSGLPYSKYYYQESNLHFYSFATNGLYEATEINLTPGFFAPKGILFSAHALGKYKGPFGNTQIIGKHFSCNKNSFRIAQEDSFENLTSPKLSPNPVNSGEVVSLNATVDLAQIFSSNGVFIQSIENQSSFSTKGMDAGIYIVKADSETLKLIVQ